MLGCPASETEEPQGLGRNQSWLCWCWDPWAELGKSQSHLLSKKRGLCPHQEREDRVSAAGVNGYLTPYCSVVPSPPHGSGFHAGSHHQDTCSILPCCSQTLLCTKPHGPSWASTPEALTPGKCSSSLAQAGTASPSKVSAGRGA